LGIILFCLLLVAGTALADERGNAAEAKQMVQDAIAFIHQVGPEKAFEDFNTPGSARWHKKDLYVFCYKMDGTNVAYGALGGARIVGKNLIDLKSADGQPLIRNMIGIVRTSGSGWITYQWAHPETKKTETKRAYLTKIPGYEGLLGVGIYPQ